jgi:tetratricopeptide (TPR) repeat protein
MQQMATTRYLIAAFVAASSLPAIAGVAVVGASSARMCFQAADASSRPTQRDLATCNEAIDEPGISDHDLVASYVNRGIVRLRRDLVELSLRDFDTALQMDPNQPEASLNKGAALMRQDHVREALPLFTVALEHHTNRPAMAHFGRAIAYEALGDVQSAYRDYQLASELEPDWAQPRTELQRFRVRTR